MCYKILFMPQNKSTPSLYFNRELSWLAFNRRVLNLGEESSYPLLERMRFLAISSSNLDEFFEIRVAGLIQQLESGVSEVGFDGLGPREQLRRIRAITFGMVFDQYRIWKEQIVPELKEKKIFLKSPGSCNPAEKVWIKKYFDENISPALTPMAVDPAHPFPHLRNKGLYVLLSIAPENQKRAAGNIAIVPIPPNLQRVVRVEVGKPQEYSVLFLSEVVKYFSGDLFPGYKVRSASVFRITRNSDLYFDEEETENLLKTIEQEIHKRKQGAAVRLEIEESVAATPLQTLLEAIDLPPEFVFKIPAHPVNLARLFGLYDLVENPELKFSPFKPYMPHGFKSPEDIFNSIREKDFLLHHPYESFEPVENFIATAAKDQNVMAIKLTLYRTSSGSPILKSLKDAAMCGKQVTVLVELKARFDEENNIQWARELEDKGVHVVYGIVGLKTHCKICMVVRNEQGALRRYAHLGTGNYNSKTAKIYTDLSLFTANNEICTEVANLFNALTGKAAEPKFEKLLVAPFNFHSEFISKIDREIKFAKAKKSARIIIKANSVLEPSVIQKLYEASQAGVKIDLIVRGICALIPGIKGISSNITVRSIVGIYLEHSRIYYFENGGKPELYAGSGDLMQRNMFRRIECIYPILDERIKSRIIENILDPLLKDNTFASLLHVNGAYYKSADMCERKEQFCAQEYFMAEANKLSAQPILEVSKPDTESV